MKSFELLLFALLSVSPHRGAIYLAGEPVRLEPAVEFTKRQMLATSESTRAGFVRFASTEHGRQLIEWLVGNGCEVTVYEDAAQRDIGLAPQPGFTTLLRQTAPAFELVLNPAIANLPRGMSALINEPATPDELMAMAWAAEMLHISFYAHGVSLPHHPRTDFQDAWKTLASELGYPLMEHGDDELRSLRPCHPEHQRGAWRDGRRDTGC